MAEQLTYTPEQQFEPETIAKAERRLPDAAHAEKLRRGEKDPLLALKEARTSVHETVETNSQPDPLEQLKTAEKAAQPTEPVRVDRQLKQITLQRELGQIRRQLATPERLLSKIIHQPAIRAVSEVAGKTVSRPSGLLGGGLVALIGTSGYLYLARHIGFTYNYLVFLALFFGGFIVGLLLELLVHMMTTSRHHSD